MYETNKIEPAYASERGTLLGVSLPNVSQWLTGTEEKAKSCLIKLYDENIRAFKLNDVVTFIGILEFNPSTAEEQKDTEMVDANSTESQLRTGIPND